MGEPLVVPGGDVIGIDLQGPIEGFCRHLPIAQVAEGDLAPEEPGLGLVRIEVEGPIQALQGVGDGPSARDRFASSRRSATGRSSARVGMVMAKIKIGIDIGIDLRIEVSIGNGEMRAPGLMRRRSDSPSIIPFGGRSLVVLHSLFHPSPPTTNP